MHIPSDPGIDSSESRMAQLTFMSRAHGNGGATTGTFDGCFIVSPYACKYFPIQFLHN